MLLNHHCVYPARMFGEGRVLMDFTIAGGMMLGQDVCGGVKLWPQHRYAAAEMALSSVRSGVREVTALPPLPLEEERGGEDTSPRKRQRSEGTQVQLLHELSEVALGVTLACNGTVPDEEEIPWYATRSSTDRFQWVPRYYDDARGAHGRIAKGHPLATVLDVTNSSIIAEARMRQRRLQRAGDNFLHYRSDDSDGAEEEESSESEGGWG